MRCFELAVGTTALVSFGGFLHAQTEETEQDEALSEQDVRDIVRESLPFEVHGGVLLWHYEPFLEGAENHSEIYYVNLVLDAEHEDFGFHFEPRFRDTKLRQFFESNVWAQEAYLSWSPPSREGGILKTGKVYSRFGRFWDGVFYGNIPYFDGLKLDPDIGISWEENRKLDERKSLEYSLQFFTRDGSTNGSLQGRDTLSIGGVERNSFVGRVAPTFTIGENTNLTVGASAMTFEADLPTPTPNDDVTRWNLEASLTKGPVTVFGDYAHQSGHHVVDFPVPGATSDDIDYLMSGLAYQWNDWTFRYNYSFGDYNDEDIEEAMHMPGVVYQINPHVSVWLEYVYWDRDDNGDTSIVDRSLNLILYASF